MTEQLGTFKLRPDAGKKSVQLFKRELGKKTRTVKRNLFQASWFTRQCYTHQWLHYDEEHDLMFSHVCESLQGIENKVECW